MVAVCIPLVACQPNPLRTTGHSEQTTASPLSSEPSKKQNVTLASGPDRRTTGSDAWTPGPDLVLCDELDWRGPLGRAEGVPVNPTTESVEFSTEDRVANGSPATSASAVGIVRVSVGGSNCTGTLIDPEWVLTAAHCAFRISDDRKMFIGASKAATVHFGREEKFGGRNVPGRIYCHAQYGMIRKSHVNDLALVHLEKSEIRETPVRIVAKGDTPMMQRPGSFFSVYGFGAKSYKRDRSGTGAEPESTNVLMTGQMQVDSTPNSCAYGKASQWSTFCADTSSDMGPAALCRGDSGGPAFVADDVLGRRQVGINSFMAKPSDAKLIELQNSPDIPDWLKASLKLGAVCGVEGNLSGFVDLELYRDWIEGAIGVELP